MSKDSRFKPFYLFTGIVIFDQLVKLFLVYFFDSLISKNTGIAFGLFLNNNFYFIYLIFLAIFIYLFPKPLTALIILIASATSNFLDRIFYGGVVDYIDFGFWPSFNLADILIVLSSVWLVLGLLKKKS